jgi:hypothetical protein
MARGWESKAVEDQMDAVETDRDLPMKERIPEDRLELERKRQSVQLSRTKVFRDLEGCQNPRYRDMLVAALANLDLQLERFEAALGNMPAGADGNEAQ